MAGTVRGRSLRGLPVRSDGRSSIGVATGDGIAVEGLVDFQRELRRMDRSLGRELGRANKAAGTFAAGRMRDRARSLGGVAAKSAPSIRAIAEQRAVKLRVGGDRYPFAMGANFGAYHDVVRQLPDGSLRLGWNQFEEWTGNQFVGGGVDRFVFSVLSEVGDELLDEYVTMLDDLARRAFPTGRL